MHKAISQKATYLHDDIALSLFETRTIERLKDMCKASHLAAMLVSSGDFRRYMEKLSNKK
jgi:hypothetical protein